MTLTFPEPKTQLHLFSEHLEDRLKAVFPTPFTVALMPPAPSKTEFERLTSRKPFVGFAFAGLKPTGSGRIFNCSSSWMVFLAVDNTEVVRRHIGDERGVGLFGMITATVFALNGWTIEGVGSVTVTGADVVVREDWANDTTAIAMVDIEVGLVIDDGIARLTRGPDDAFLTLVSTWAMAGADGAVDVATDTLSTGS